MQQQQPDRLIYCCKQHGSAILSVFFILIAALVYFSVCFFSLVYLPHLNRSTLHLCYLVLLQSPFSGATTSSAILPQSFYLVGDFPVGVPPSASEYSYVNQSVTACLMLVVARRLVCHICSHCASQQQYSLNKKKEKNEEGGMPTDVSS